MMRPLGGLSRDHDRNTTMDAVVMYVTFASSKASTLVSGLTDPKKQPMPFYCRIAEIQKDLFSYPERFSDPMSD